MSPRRPMFVAVLGWALWLALLLFTAALSLIGFGWASLPPWWLRQTLPWGEDLYTFDLVILAAAWLFAFATAWKYHRTLPPSYRPRLQTILVMAGPWAVGVFCFWACYHDYCLYVFLSLTQKGMWVQGADPPAVSFLLLATWLLLWPLLWVTLAEHRLAAGEKPGGPVRPYPGFFLVRGLCRGVWGLAYRLKVDGAERIPAGGGLILAANHASYWDAVFLQAACPRPIRWMIDDAYYRLPVLNWLFRWIGNIPVKGAHNRAALEAAIGALNKGEVVGIFPEGFLSETGRMRRARTGVSTLAARTGAAVVTAYLRGAFFAWPKGRWVPRLNRVEVRLGGPMFLRRREDITREVLQEFADAVMGSIRGMFGHGSPKREAGGPWDGRERRKGVGEPPAAC